jgi:probable HAF family extracellular repeat protein
MKSRFLMCCTAIALVVALAGPVSLAAQEHHTKHHQYKLIDMGTFGGPASYVSETIPFVNGNGDINSRGLVVGGAATSTATTKTSNPLICGGFGGIPFVFHAFEWHKGVVTDLGALSGADNCSGPGMISENGKVVGTSENGEVDPLTGVNQSRAVLWRNGGIEDLGSFGGNQNGASGINERGDIVGFSLNTTPDPFSIFDLLLGSSNGTQTRAFRWQHGHMQDLGTLGGPDASANLVNERGQIAGTSYTSSKSSTGCFPMTTDPFLWEKSTGMIDLGTLGGTCGIPLALNNHGQVVGFSNLAGDQTAHPFLWPGKDGKMRDLGTLGGSYGTANAINEAGEVAGYAGNTGDQATLAFLWRNGEMTNLGTVNGDPCSTGNAINSKRQVVGISTATCNFTTGRRAFLWENGSMVDLNTLIPPSSGLQLTLAEAINDRGEIVGNGTPTGCGIVEQCGHAFLLIPCDEHHSSVEGCDYSMVDVSAARPRPSPVVRDVSSGVQRLSPPARTNRFHIPGFAIGPRN